MNLSWLLFLDESGHDGKTTPYEVNGGIALHASRIWAFSQAVAALENRLFGTRLSDFGSEIKGAKLLGKDRFQWARQGERLPDDLLAKHAYNFLNAKSMKKTPRRIEFTAYGQASLKFVDELLELIRTHEGVLIAAIIPHLNMAIPAEIEVPRKDMVFLLERFAYLVEEAHDRNPSGKDVGLLVLDHTESNQDRALARRMEKYFEGTTRGVERARWVVPTPLFVESDMAYGVQAADVCIYIVNHAMNFKDRSMPMRAELCRFEAALRQLCRRWRRSRGGRSFAADSVFWVGDPYTARERKDRAKNKEGGKASGAT